MLIFCTNPWLLCKNQLPTVKSCLIKSYKFVSYKENTYKKKKHAHFVHQPMVTLKEPITDGQIVLNREL